MSSLSRDWVWMAAPGGVPILEKQDAILSLSLLVFSMQWRFFLLSRCSNCNCSVHQSIHLPRQMMPLCIFVSAVCHWECSLIRGGGGDRGMSSSSISSSTSTPCRADMCGFIFFTCERWIRGLFDYCAPRFHFLSSRWLSASYHSRFRHSNSSVDTKKVATSIWVLYQAKDDDAHTHAHTRTHTAGLTCSASGLNHSKCEWDVRR